MKTENTILEMSFNFSLQVIDLYKKLVESKEYVLSKQVLKECYKYWCECGRGNSCAIKKRFYF